MHALVVYESMFGNTQAIANAVAEGLAIAMKVDVREVGTADATVPDDVDLLVVGGPTHAFGLSRPSTRRNAATQGNGSVISAGIGIREWLHGLQGVRRGLAAAAFDTRADKPRLPGRAANATNRRLRRLGAHILTPPQSFYVAGMTGPLVASEAERAREWAEWIVAQSSALRQA